MGNDCIIEPTLGNNSLVGNALGFVWLEMWKSERIENDGMMEKLEDRKDFNLSPFCLVGRGKVER